MRRAVVCLALAAVLAAPVSATASTPPHKAAAASARSATEFVSLRSHFGFRSSPRYSLRSPRYSYGRSRHPFLRRVVKTAFWLYVLHLFTAHGGLSILLWIVVIFLLLSLVRRRRRRYVL